MARPTLFSHRKFRRLCSLIGEPRALGCLEWIWMSGYESGDPLLGSPSDVELAGKWDGKKGRLVEALEDAGFIDKLNDGKYEIHDLFDHAPDYVQRRMMREAERMAKGKTISDLRKEAAAQRWKKNMQVNANDIHLLASECNCHANDATPAPAPAPALNNNPHTPTGGDDKFFLEFWAMYPKRIGKGAAERAWKKIKGDKDKLLDQIGEALGWQCASENWKKENGQYIPNPSTYLNQRRWEDGKELSL